MRSVGRGSGPHTYLLQEGALELRWEQIGVRYAKLRQPGHGGVSELSHSLLIGQVNTVTLHYLWLLARSRWEIYATN